MGTAGGGCLDGDQGDRGPAAFSQSLSYQAGAEVTVDLGGDIPAAGGKGNGGFTGIDGGAAADGHDTVGIMMEDVAFQTVNILPGSIGLCAGYGFCRNGSDTAGFQGCKAFPDPVG